MNLIRISGFYQRRSSLLSACLPDGPLLLLHDRSYHHLHQSAHAIVAIHRGAPLARIPSPAFSPRGARTRIPASPVADGPSPVYGVVSRFAARNSSSAAFSTTQRSRWGSSGCAARNRLTVAAASGDRWLLSVASIHRFGKKMSPVF